MQYKYEKKYEKKIVKENKRRKNQNKIRADKLIYEINEKYNKIKPDQIGGFVNLVLDKIESQFFSIKNKDLKYFFSLMIKDKPEIFFYNKKIIIKTKEILKLYAKKNFNVKEEELFLKILKLFIFEKKNLNLSLSLLSDSEFIRIFNNSFDLKNEILKKYYNVYEKNEKKYYVDLINYLNTNKDINFCNNRFSIYTKKADLKKEIENLNKRNVLYDLRKMLTFTIDTKKTLIRDDAFSIKKLDNDNYLLCIHITDINSQSYKKDKEKIIVCNKRSFSLNKNEDKRANSLLIEIDNCGQIVNYRLIKSLININYNFKFSYFSNETKKERNVDERIKLLIKLYEKMNNPFFKNEICDTNILCCLVKKYMLLYNGIIGTMLKEKNICGLYLTNNIDNEKKFSMKPKLIDTGFKDINYYTKATSPIYDYSSLITSTVINEILIPNYIKKDDYKYWEDNLPKMVKILNKR